MSPDEEHAGGGIEESACGVDGRLEVPCQSAVAADPGEESLNEPALRIDGEADLIGVLAYDLDGDTGGAGHALAGIAAVGEDLLDERERPSRHAEQRPGAVAVLEARRMRLKEERRPRPSVSTRVRDACAPGSSRRRHSRAVHQPRSSSRSGCR